MNYKVSNDDFEDFAEYLYNEKESFKNEEFVGKEWKQGYIKACERILENYQIWMYDKEKYENIIHEDINVPYLNIQQPKSDSPSMINKLKNLIGL